MADFVFVNLKKTLMSIFFSVTVFTICALLLSGTVKNELLADDLDNATVSDLYSQAREFFRQANIKSAKSEDEAVSLYKKSAMRYERLIKEGGIQNGKIYYNLGNIYFKINDIGRAILNYRRAEQYIPNDSNLKQNLKYARGQRTDKIEEKQETKVLKTLFFWHYDLSVKTRIMLFTIFFAFVWISACLRIFFKKSFLFWVITVCAIISIMLSGSLGAEEYFLKKTRPGVILSTETVARKGNSETYEPSFKEPLHAGTEFTLIENRGDWYQIELPDSRTCWVASDDVELVR
jgi:tetratricopeptide (TPR) repeat protein